MSKKSLDLEYMKKALKVKTDVRAGRIQPLYGVPPEILLYGVPEATE